MKKNQNLKIILAIEIALVLCIGIGIVGIIIYAVSGSQSMPAAENPPMELSTATNVPTSIPTSIPTNTPETSPASEHAATETSIVTPLPEANNTSLERQPDGTIKFTDYDSGYEVTYPKDWLAFRPENEEEFNAALAKVGTKNTALIEQMKSDKSSYKANADRIFSYPLLSDQNLLLGFSGIEFFPNDTRPLDNRSMGIFVNNLETSPDLPGLRVRVADFKENGNQVPMVFVKGTYLSKGGVTVLVRFLIFKPTSSSVIRMSFAMADFDGFGTTQDVDEIQESIKLLNE